MQTPALETDVVKSVQVDVVCVDEDSPRHAGGRPLKLNVQRFLRICGWIQKGKSNSESCRIEQIDYTSFCAHKRRKKRWQWRYELADRVRDDYLRDWHLGNVVRHSENNWVASAWLLERKFPHLFALRPVNRDNGQSDQLVGDKIPAERLSEYGREMLEFAREEEARKAAPQPAGDQAALPDGGAEVAG